MKEVNERLNGQKAVIERGGRGGGMEIYMEGKR